MNILVRDPLAFALLMLISTVLSGLLIWAGARLTKGTEVPLVPSFLMGLGASIVLWIPVALSVLVSGALIPGAVIGLILTVPFLRLALSLALGGTFVVWVFNAFAQILALTVMFSPTGERAIAALTRWN